jgi:hypothetical protein
MEFAMAAERYPTKEKAAIEIYGRTGALIATIKDLSKTGACLIWESTDTTLNKGDLLRLTVVLRALRREHRLNAEVVWIEGKRTGVQFLNSRELLDKMLIRGV